MKAKRWEHTCDKCRYIGSGPVYRHGPVDWYVCDDTILGRFGDEPSDYWSMLQSLVVNLDSPMARAAKEALGGRLL